MNKIPKSRKDWQPSRKMDEEGNRPIPRKTSRNSCTKVCLYTMEANEGYMGHPFLPTVWQWNYLNRIIDFKAPNLEFEACWTNSLHHPRQICFLKFCYDYRVCLYVLWYTCEGQRTALRSALSFHLCVGSGNPSDFRNKVRSMCLTLLAISSTRDNF